jgi:Tfp pilus assembly protein PilX
MRRSGKAKLAKERAVAAELDAERLLQRAEQLARAIEEFLRRRTPLHSGPECSDGQVELLDWSAAGCEALCALCLLNRALSIYRMRA